MISQTIESLIHNVVFSPLTGKIARNIVNELPIVTDDPKQIL